MNVFIVDLAQQPGELAKAAEAIARKGINITSFSGATCGASASIAFLTNDEAGTRKALLDAGYRPRELEVTTTTLENEPGALAKTARRLGDAGINIEVAFVTATSGGNVTLAFATDDAAKARRVLGSQERIGIGVR